MAFSSLVLHARVTESTSALREEQSGARSFTTRSVVHAPAMYEVHCGRIFATHPSVGAWVTYGLGSESDNLAEEHPEKIHKVYIDPMGPTRGQHHVVRGSSWRHASSSVLRYSYRDYSAQTRDDLGAEGPAWF